MSFVVENFSVDNLCHNQIFITTMLQATQAAVRSHVEKKSLQNAVLNSALQIHPDEDEMLMFLNYIDIFTRLTSEDTFVYGIKKYTSCL